MPPLAYMSSTIATMSVQTWSGEVRLELRGCAHERTWNATPPRGTPRRGGKEPQVVRCRGSSASP